LINGRNSLSINHSKKGLEKSLPNPSKGGAFAKNEAKVEEKQKAISKRQKKTKSLFVKISQICGTNQRTKSNKQRAN
jgi:hypothetical protein